MISTHSSKAKISSQLAPICTPSQNVSEEPPKAPILAANEHTLKANTSSRSSLAITTTKLKTRSSGPSSESGCRKTPRLKPSSLPIEDVEQETPPSASQPSVAPSSPLTAIERPAHISTMQSELQRLGPLSSHPHQRVRNSREVLFRQILKDSIVSAKTAESITLRVTIAQEVKASVQGLLAAEERDPKRTLTIVRSRSRSYWSSIHEEIYRSGSEDKTVTDHIKNIAEREAIHQLYSLRDIERILFYWSNNQHVKSYGEIAYELCLPLGVLSSWILCYVQ